MCAAHCCARARIAMSSLRFSPSTLNHANTARPTPYTAVPSRSCRALAAHDCARRVRLCPLCPLPGRSLSAPCPLHIRPPFAPYPLPARSLAAPWPLTPSTVSAPSPFSVRSIPARCPRHASSLSAPCPHISRSLPALCPLPPIFVHQLRDEFPLPIPSLSPRISPLFRTAASRWSAA